MDDPTLKQAMMHKGMSAVHRRQDHSLRGFLRGQASDSILAPASAPYQPVTLRSPWDAIISGEDADGGRVTERINAGERTTKALFKRVRVRMVPARPANG